jgi:energy-coupling factor transport system permease protein
MISTIKVDIDPRTKILLLIIANIVAFVQQSFNIEITFIITLELLLLTSGCTKTAIKWILIFVITLAVQYYVFPILPKIVRNLFFIMTLYFRRFFPCLMIGTLIIETSSIREIVVALQKWKFPQQIIIPLCITIRYFPAIREELVHIKDAIKLRRIKRLNKMEYYLVPLMISATNTAEELSAAAVTRGIENPNYKTSLIELQFNMQDYICLFLGVIFIIVAFTL